MGGESQVYYWVLEHQSSNIFQLKQSQTRLLMLVPFVRDVKGRSPATISHQAPSWSKAIRSLE